MIKIISSILDMLSDFIGVVVDCVLSIIQSLFSEGNKTAYDASYHKNPSEIISSYNLGFTVNGLKNISIKNSYMNQIVYGGSGSGKTSNIIIPNLLHSIGKSNYIVNDPSSEIRLAVSGALHKKGENQKILIFDPSKPEISVKFNPLARVKSVSEANKLAQLLILNTLGNKASDPFWQISAISILSLIFRLLAFHSPKKFCTIHNALFLLDNLSFGGKVDILIVKTRDKVLYSEYKSFVANDVKLKNSILATAKSALGLFTLDTVQIVTCEDTVDFNAFRSESVTLFINNNIANAKLYAPLTAVLLQQFCDFILNELPPVGSKPIFFILDESFSIFFPDLPLILSNVRKYLCGFCLIYQSYHQVCEQYNAQNAKSVEANCWTRIFLPGTPIDIAENLSKEMGSFEFTESDSEKQHVRSLMTASEIKECKDVLIFCGAHRALRLPVKPFYLTYLKKLADIPPYKPVIDMNQIVPPLIPLDEK